VVAAAAALAVPGTVRAQPDFRMIWTPGDHQSIDFNWRDVNGRPGGFGTLHGYDLWTVPGDAARWEGYRYSGGLLGSGSWGGWQLEWDCVFSDAEPSFVDDGSAFVTANVVVTNIDLANIQTFSLLMSLPVTPIADPAERGSIVGTVTDLTGDDATVFARTGTRIYTPRIDGIDEPPGFMMVDPFTTSAGGPFFSATVGPADFGVPGWVPATQSVDESIGIFLEFDLTPGDTASFTAIYEVAVPGPGVLALLGLGVLRGRRRRAAT
jgi:hypothetical protein